MKLLVLTSILMKRPVLFALLIFIALTGYAADRDSLSPPKKRINIVISNKSVRLDPALMSTHIQAWWNQLFHRKKMHFMVVKTIEEAVERVNRLMEKENALIDNIWFDSHGHMGRRLALLEIGDVELNYQTIRDPWFIEKVSAIGRYCDSNSKVVLGSCYSGAEYMSGGTDSFPPRKMNGDKLMEGAGALFNQATIYASVSWITTKPGFFNGRYATAGHPWAKRFKDPKFQPVWDSLGVWKSYTAKDGIRLCNTVVMDHSANIFVKDKAFLDIPKYRKKQQRKMKKIKDGNFPDKYFHKFRDPLHVANNKKFI
jgi:hypothetical protein